jgi:hypothetical protein
MTRNEALDALAAEIVKKHADLARLCQLADEAGLARLAAAIRRRTVPRKVGAIPRLDPHAWEMGEF